MEKWEHDIALSLREANDMGSKGWEAVGFSDRMGYTILMKRRIEEYIPDAQEQYMDEVIKARAEYQKSKE